MVKIDLHTHSTRSDGLDTPSDLIANAAKAGLDVIALTDHDTVSVSYTHLTLPTNREV